MGAALSALMAVMLPSCHGIYDGDLPPCPHGVSLRFVYDYNMEYANAFPTKVDCVTLYVYDKAGHYVKTLVETSNVLQDEEWRMLIDLAEGDYHFVAYGGLACNEASFAVKAEPGSAIPQLSELSVEMDHVGLTSEKKLHDLFFGTLDVTVSGDAYQNAAIRMMKDTNNLRVVLQQLNGQPLSDEDFIFCITDDNTLLDNTNHTVPNGIITYSPWAQGQYVVGEDGNDGVTVVYAELSTSRLVTSNAPRFIVRRTTDGKEIINIPLNEYLLLLKSDLYSDMGAQEFLDRESEWSLVFFLDANREWVTTQVIINNWVVRLNGVTITL